MDKKRKPKKNLNEGSIQIGDINNAVGVAVGSSAQAIVVQHDNKIVNNEIDKAFFLIRKKIDAITDDSTKEKANVAVDGLEQEAYKGEAAAESDVNKWLSFLAQTAPDAWDVAVSCFSSPIAGISKVFQLISKRAKEEQNAKRT